MEIKIFGDKKVVIQKLSKKHLKEVIKFQDFINSLVEEGAPILVNKKLSLKEEKEWLDTKVKLIQKQKETHLIAKSEGKIVGSTDIGIGIGCEEHIGNFGISIRKDYRRIGLGKYLTKEIIKLAKKELIPRPKIIRLGAFSTNKPALIFYNKLGFKKVAEVPKQFKYKGKLVNEIIMLLYL